MSIGEKIRCLRKEKGLTQRQLAEDINFSHSYIGDLESNRTNPSIKTLEILADYFNVEMTSFFDRKCCYEKLLNGIKDFCYSNKEECKECPIKLIGENDLEKIGEAENIKTNDDNASITSLMPSEYSGNQPLDTITNKAKISIETQKSMLKKT